MSHKSFEACDSSSCNKGDSKDHNAQSAISQCGTPQPDSTPESHGQFPTSNEEIMDYEYEPFPSRKHIRVLRIAPGTDDMPLTCSLIQVDLDQHWGYEAISYAWGDPNDCKYIICEGKRIRITRNLFEALHVFRQSSTYRDFWADAICINQQNLQERGEQVQLMAKVYSKATGVLMWLGLENPEVVQTAIGFLERCMADILGSINPDDLQSCFVGARLNSFKLGKMLQEKDWKIPPGISDEAIHSALTPMFCCNVFRRGWVIQEFSLATRIHICWNQSSVEASTVFLPVNLLVAERGLSFFDKIECINGYHALLAMTIISLKGKTTSEFLRSIWYSCVSLFSDDRDRIYGLLALKNQEDGAEDDTVITPDYTIDVSVTYRNFAESWLLRENDLELLMFIDHMEKVDDTWPSWTPDWRIRTTGWRLLFWMYNFGSKQLRIQSHDSLPGCVIIRGIRIAPITTVLGGYDSWEQYQDLLCRLFDQFEPECVACTATAGQHKSMFSTFLHGNEDEVSVRIRGCRQLLEQHVSKLRQQQWRLDVDGRTLVDLCGSGFLSFIYHKCFFITSKGMLGVGSKRIRSGDTVAILFSGSGPNLPFILRPVGNLWKLVGPCFVYDLKDGSAVRQWEESGEEAEAFIIC